jgi:hypothetical protein
MTILLPSLAVTFAAFVVWLTVRLINRRKKPGKVFWVIAVIHAALIGYPLSFIPVSQLQARGILPFDSVVVIYKPIRGALHAVLRRPRSRKFVALGNERVEIAMEQTVASMYGPATD